MWPTCMHAWKHENNGKKLVYKYKQIINQRNKYEKIKRILSLHVSYFRVILHSGLALSKVGFGSLHLFRDWMTLKAPKLFPNVVHARLVGYPDPHPLQATNGKSSIWVEVFCEPIRRLTPHESWLLASPKVSYGRGYCFTVWMDA